jgi:hypothetical protein
MRDCCMRTLSGERVEKKNETDGKKWRPGESA